jgi:hypothetical protein
MISRADYIAGKATHQAYYGQFVNDTYKKRVLGRIRFSQLLASRDPCFNDIPLAKRDVIASQAGLGSTTSKMKECGDYLTLAGHICILKEAARQLVEANKFNRSTAETTETSNNLEG